MKSKRDFTDTFIEQWRSNPNQSIEGIEDCAFLFRILRFSSLLEKNLEKLCFAHSITSSQFQTLAALRRFHPRGLTANDLIQETVLSSGSVTSMLHQLIQKTLVTKKTSASDKRQIEVHLTAKGLDLIRIVQEQRMADLRGISNTFSKKDRLLVNGLLRKVLLDFDSV